MATSTIVANADITLRCYGEAVSLIEQRPEHPEQLAAVNGLLGDGRPAAKAAGNGEVGDIIAKLHTAFTAGLDELSVLIELGDSAGVDMLSSELAAYLRTLLAEADAMIANE